MSENAAKTLAAELTACIDWAKGVRRMLPTGDVVVAFRESRFNKLHTAVVDYKKALPELLNKFVVIDAPDTQHQQVGRHSVAHYPHGHSHQSLTRLLVNWHGTILAFHAYMETHKNSKTVRDETTFIGLVKPPAKHPYWSATTVTERTEPSSRFYKACAAAIPDHRVVGRS